MSLNVLLRFILCFSGSCFLPFSDRYVIVGSHHHTAHSYDRQEWASSTAMITAFIRALMLRVKKGWRPDRTIVFCSWGGTAFGNIGSYEWGEVNVHELLCLALIIALSCSLSLAFSCSLDQSRQGKTDEAVNRNVHLHQSVLYAHLLLLSHFSRVRLCATPQTATHQAPPSPGFSRQENWSGLPFPSPMHESEK